MSYIVNKLLLQNMYDNSFLFRISDHWCSTFKYWLIGLGVMALVVLIVYNSVVAFSMLPIAYTKAVKSSQTPYSIFDNPSTDQLSVSDIYMHVFADNKNEINLNDYLPHAEVISKRYPDFKFHLIIVINETFKDIQQMSDETKNILALNSLLVPYDNTYRIEDDNLFVEYVSINKYLSNPIVQNINSNVSKELIEFLVRILSIWEKGGISFNPIILTPTSLNNHYMEKIQNLLIGFLEFRHKKRPIIEKISRQPAKLPKPKKKFDNIRDIINALEEDERLYNISQHNLTETEDRIYSVNVDAANRRNFFKNENVSTPYNYQTIYHQNDKQSEDTAKKKLNTPLYLKGTKQNFSTYEVNEINLSRNSTQSRLLPLFLELIYPKIGELSSMHKESRKERSHHPRFEGNQDITPVFKYIEKDSDNNYKAEKGSLVNEENAQLTIDLKGNVIASNIPCHAFIGNLLRDSAHHYDNETLSEFIIAELTVFCNGTLSSCKGIDVILL